jgi:hypothetical protein
VVRSRSNGSVDGAAERGKRGENRGGSDNGDATRRGARGARLRPLPDCGACGRRADTTDVWAPVVGGRGSEKREARHAWAGPGRKRRGPSLDE